MRRWSSSGRIKIERAEKHIGDFAVERDAFRKRRPYVVIPERHPKDWDAQFPHGATLYRIREREVVPPRLSLIAADAVHNLHVALDYLWQRAIYGTDGRDRDYFPIYESPDRAETRFKGKEKGRCKEMVDILRSVDAFKVGNPFWPIRCFDDADKHDTLRLVACQLQELHLNVEGQGRLIVLPPKEQGFRFLKDGTELLVGPPIQPETHVSDDIAFEIAFDEGQILERESVLPTLKHFAATVRSLSELCIAAKLLD